VVGDGLVGSGTASCAQLQLMLYYLKLENVSAGGCDAFDGGMRYLYFTCDDDCQLLWENGRK
jgi:hypothetical protein